MYATICEALESYHEAAHKLLSQPGLGVPDINSNTPYEPRIHEYLTVIMSPAVHFRHRNSRQDAAESPIGFCISSVHEHLRKKNEDWEKKCLPCGRKCLCGYYGTVSCHIISTSSSSPASTSPTGISRATHGPLPLCGEGGMTKQHMTPSSFPRNGKRPKKRPKECKKKVPRQSNQPPAAGIQHSFTANRST